MPVDANRPVQCIIQPRNQLHQRGFAFPGAADDADRFAGVDVQTDILQVQHLGIVRIAEIDVIELDLSACNLQRTVFGGNDVKLLVENLIDAVKRGLRHRKADHQERQHQKGGDHLRRIAHQTREVSDVQRRSRLDDFHAAERKQNQRTGPHDAELNWVRQRKQLLRVNLRFLEIVGRIVELSDLVLLAHKRFHNARADQILLHRAVHAVVLLQHDFKPLESDADHDIHHRRDHGNREHENHRKLRVDPKRHSRRENQHHGRANKNPQKLLVDVLEVVDVGRRPHHKRRGLKPVGVAKRERLNAFKQRVAKVLRKPHARHSRRARRQRAERQRKQRRQNHQPAGPEHKLQIVSDRQQRKKLLELIGFLVIQSAVHERRHQKRNHHLERDFADHQKRCEKRRQPVSRRTGQKRRNALILFCRFPFHFSS